MVLKPEFKAALASIIRPIYASNLPDSLDAMRGWLGKLTLLKPTYPIIAVTGSVGKGSTALALARHFSHYGWRIGLYTSPHLHSFRERFQIDGEMISQEAFVSHAEKVLAITQDDILKPSTFETATLIAFDWFAAKKIDLAVCEIGMGGRFDAVNAIPNQLAIFTPVELEHASALGGSLETIAWHKVGILHSKSVGISLPQLPAVRAVFEREAASLNASIMRANNDSSLLKQAANIIKTRLPVEGAAGKEGQWDSQLPGRLEVIRSAERTYIVDGAHTASSAARLRANLDTFAPQPILLIAALLRDKPAAKILSPFDAPQFHVVIASLPGHRGGKADDVLNQWRPRYARTEIAESIETALEMAALASERLIVFCGSLRTAAIARELLGQLTAAALIESRFTRDLFENDDYPGKIR